VSVGAGYRDKARELLARAEVETSSLLKIEFEELAGAYLRLAEQAEHGGGEGDVRCAGGAWRGRRGCPLGGVNVWSEPYHPEHGKLILDAYMCAERQEPCPNSQMIKTAHAYIA
jgi:hypothetical protein